MEAVEEQVLRNEMPYGEQAGLISWIPRLKAVPAGRQRESIPYRHAKNSMTFEVVELGRLQEGRP